MAILAAVAMSLGISMSVATPAQAATINGCDAYYVCLYDWINNNYASGFWQRSVTAISAQADGGVSNCLNLNDHYWHDLNGRPNNTASSLIINGSTSAGGTLTVAFRENLCGGGGEELIYQMPRNGLAIEQNLASSSKDPFCYNFTCPWNWYDRISSIRIYSAG